MSRKIAIAAAKRTPLGSLMGVLGAVSAPALGATALSAALADARLAPATVDEVLMGCVLPAGLGQAPARQAALQAGLPVSSACTTINKVCGSGMKAVMLGADQILAGNADIILAGGMESMSNAPYLAPRARQGLRLGHGQLLDHMFFDGLQNAADGELMGEFAERCVERYGFSRQEQDEYATRSVHRARRACKDGSFASEIAPVRVRNRGTETLVGQDEEPFRADPKKIPHLKPAFRTEGTVTAASSASIADGAAALVLLDTAEAERRDLRVLAHIVASTTHSQAPEDFTTAPIGAVKKLFERTGWTHEEVDLYEINEAFAAVAMAAQQDLEIDADILNVHGGACALGHPIGASGARLIVTLIHALRARGLRRGIASLCIGGGEATAIAIEMAG